MIYLDHNATTPVLPEVFSVGLGNTASDIHETTVTVQRCAASLGNVP